jgi:hypothetical protein
MAIILGFRRTCLCSVYFGSLLACRCGLRVAFGHMHTTYVDFFFEYKATLDNNGFFDDGQDCRITFFPDRRYDGDSLPIRTRSTSTRVWDKGSSM